METLMDLELSTYKQTQDMLFKQILHAVMLASAAALLLSLSALFLPAIQITSVLLLAVLVAFEIAISMISSWFLLRDREHIAALFFLIATMVNGTLVAGLLGFPAFAALISALLIAVGALLIGPRYAFVPGVIGILLFGMLSIVQQQGWLAGVAITEEPWAALLLDIGFVIAVLAVLMVVCALASKRLQRSAYEAQVRAEQAAYIHSMQVTLNEQVQEEITKERRLMAVIQELEAPIMPVLEGVLVLPLVGQIDQQRLTQIQLRLLQRVATDATRLVLIDVTTLRSVDASIANGLLQLSQSVRLLGAEVALSGLRPATAQALVELKIDLHFIKTFASLQDALTQLEWQRAAVARGL